MIFEDAFKLDLLVERLVVVELKSVENFAPVHYKQLLTYLRLTKLPVGLLLNFGAATLKDGLKRVVNDWGSHQPSQLRINQRPTEGNHD